MRLALVGVLAVNVVAAASVLCASPSSADPIDPSCERVPILGLDPHIRIICDTPIWPDGSWTRHRKLRWLTSTKSSCGGDYYPGGNCPPWVQNDVVPGREIVDSYEVTWDTIPPGEPGHLGD